MIQKQNQEKEHLLAIYEKLKAEMDGFGEDVVFVPKITYVSVKRKKQFAARILATKTHVETGINLKGQFPQGVLDAKTKSNPMYSHKINISYQE